MEKASELVFFLSRTNTIMLLLPLIPFFFLSTNGIIDLSFLFQYLNVTHTQHEKKTLTQLDVT